MTIRHHFSVQFDPSVELAFNYRKKLIEKRFINLTELASLNENASAQTQFNSDASQRPFEGHSEMENDKNVL